VYGGGESLNPMMGFLIIKRGDKETKEERRPHGE
jgi:hypothetical protein